MDSKNIGRLERTEKVIPLKPETREALRKSLEDYSKLPDIKSKLKDNNKEILESNPLSGNMDQTEINDKVRFKKRIKS